MPPGSVSTFRPGLSIDDPKYLDHCQSCYEAYLTCIDDQQFRKYPDCYYHSYDVLEFFWKTLSLNTSGNYQRWHLPDETTFDTLMASYTTFLSPKEIANIKSAYISHNTSWSTGNPIGRQHSRYGNGSANGTPYDLYPSTSGQVALQEAKLVAGSLARINRGLRTSTGVTTIGLLNGRFSPNDPSEHPCNISDWADFSATFTDDWYVRLGAIPNAIVEKVSILKISNRFQIIVNPFGEDYPDLPRSRNVLPAFNIIRNYIGCGGIFVTAGGHPFTYYYDVTTGVRHDVKRVIQNVVSGTPRVTVQNGIPTFSIPLGSVITDNLLNIDFDAETTWDTGSLGPMDCVTFQTQAEKKFWDQNSPLTLQEFRSIDPTMSSTSIPVIRANRSDNKEVFLAALMPYGLGYLYHMGLGMGRGRVSEFDFASEAVKQVCTNYLAYF